MKVSLVEVLEDKLVSAVAEAEVVSQVEVPQVERYELWIRSSLLEQKTKRRGLKRIVALKRAVELLSQPDIVGVAPILWLEEDVHQESLVEVTLPKVLDQGIIAAHQPHYLPQLVVEVLHASIRGLDLAQMLLGKLPLSLSSRFTYMMS